MSDDIGTAAQNAALDAFEQRGGGTSSEDMRAYAQAAGGAAAVAACNSVGAGVASTFCAELGAEIAGWLYDRIPNASAPGPAYYALRDQKKQARQLYSRAPEAMREAMQRLEVVYRRLWKRGKEPAFFGLALLAHGAQIKLDPREGWKPDYSSYPDARSYAFSNSTWLRDMRTWYAALESAEAKAQIAIVSQAAAQRAKAAAEEEARRGRRGKRRRRRRKRSY